MRIRAGLLTVATAFPVVLAVVAGLRVLAGGFDAQSFPVGDPYYSWVTAEPVLQDRLGWMLASVGFAPALTCGAIGCLALAALRWVPGPWGIDGAVRRIAGVLAAAIASVGLVLTVLVPLSYLAPLTELQQQLSQPQEPSDGTVVISVVGVGTPFSDAAAVFVPAVLCAAAAWALLRRPST